jgi:predicted HicB family RNase H-like nuclease
MSKPFPKYTPIKISIHPDVWQEIKNMAAEMGIPANHLVEQSLRRTIKK